MVNVRAGIGYFRRLLRAFGSTEVALMAYNAGPNRILRYLQEDGDIPERFLVYPKRVQGELNRLRKRAAPSRGSVAANWARTPRAGCVPTPRAALLITPASRRRRPRGTRQHAGGLKHSSAAPHPRPRRARS